MSYSVLDIRNDLSAILHGTSTNQITNFYGLLFRAATEVLGDIDPEETRRTNQLLPLYGQAAFDYACPADLKGNRIIDLKPQANRKPSDLPIQMKSQDFDRFKTEVLTGSAVEVHWDTYSRSLRVALPNPGNVLINSCDSVTGNGTWSVGAGASNLATDELYKVAGAGSLKYAVNGGSYVTNSTMTAVDLTNFVNTSVIFAWVYLQSNLPTSMVLWWGSGPASVMRQTVTTQWDGTAFQVGWNLLGFDWLTALPIGVINPAAVNFIRFDTNIVGIADPVRLDNIVAANGSIYELEYYSKYIFRDSVGAFKEKPTAETDLINLDTDSYQVYLNKLALLAAQVQQGKDSAFDLGFFRGQYADSLLEYYRKYPSQAQKVVGSYYKVRPSSFARKFGGTILKP